MNIVYSNGDYTIIRTKVPRNRQYKVFLTKDSKYHTHMKTKKEAIDVANFAKHDHIPRDAKIDYLVSLERLVISDKVKSDITNLIEIKESKKNRRYVNRR